MVRVVPVPFVVAFSKGKKVAVKKVLKNMSAPIKEKSEIYLQGQMKHENVLSIITTTEDDEFR